MDVREALLRLHKVAATTVVQRLGELCGPDLVALADDQLPPDGGRPFDGIHPPCWAVILPYVGGVTGGNVLVLRDSTAERLAESLLGDDATVGGGFGDLESSAITEAMNLTMAAVAGATARFIRRPIDIGAPEMHRADDAVTLERLRPAASDHALPIDLVLFGETCRLVQFVPRSFVLRTMRGAEGPAATDGELRGEARPVAAGDVVASTLRRSTVRVWAEFGRIRIPLSDLLAHEPGDLMTVDARADEPVAIFVNGARYATGTLTVDAHGHWAVRVDGLYAAAAAAA